MMNVDPSTGGTPVSNTMQCIMAVNFLTTNTNSEQSQKELYSSGQ